MGLEDDLRRAQGAAGQAAWETDANGIVGVGHDESRLVRATVDHSDALQHLDIGARWWQSIGPDGMAAAVQGAYEAACRDRMEAWAQRTQVRSAADGEPAPDPLRGAGRGRRAAPDWDEQVAELRRTLDSLRQARAELRQLRQTVQEQSQRETVGRDPRERVTVVVVGGRVTAVQFSRRWLNEQPSGRAVADAVRDATRQAYAAIAQQSAAAVAAMPTLSAARADAADPTAMFRRLGLID